MGVKSAFLFSVSALFLGFWGTRVDLMYFVTLVTSTPPEGTETPDMLCMMTSCGQETFSCLTNRDCLKNLACLLPCGNDQACTFSCIVNYENQIFHELNKCNIHDAGCIKLKDPDEEEICDLSKDFAVPNLSQNMLKGTWYIMKGLNPIYDCFPCQIFTFAHNSTDERPMVYMDYQVEKLDGSILDKTVIEYIEVPLETKQGFMEFSGIQNGLWHSEHWRVIEINKDYFIAEYCGSMKTWVYRGAVVFSRSSPVNAATLSDIELSLEQHGFSHKEFCSPKYQGCTNTRTL